MVCIVWLQQYAILERQNYRISKKVSGFQGFKWLRRGEHRILGWWNYSVWYLNGVNNDSVEEPYNCTTQRVNPKVNYVLKLIIHQCWFTVFNKCSTVMQDNNNSENFV